MVENSSSKAEALRYAGYSEAISKVPSKITGGETWNTLLEQYFPDHKLLKVGVEGLEATKKMGNKEVPDWQNRHKFYDTALKLKGRLNQETVNAPVIIPILINNNGTNSRTQSYQSPSETD